MTNVHATASKRHHHLVSIPDGERARERERRGLAYPSSMGGNADAFALYERARDALPAAPEFHRPLADPALRAPLFEAARIIGYALA